MILLKKKSITNDLTFIKTVQLISKTSSLLPYKDEFVCLFVHVMRCREEATTYRIHEQNLQYYGDFTCHAERHNSAPMVFKSRTYRIKRTYLIDGVRVAHRHEFYGTKFLVDDPILTGQVPEEFLHETIAVNKHREVGGLNLHIAACSLVLHPVQKDKSNGLVVSKPPGISLSKIIENPGIERIKTRGPMVLI